METEPLPDTDLDKLARNARSFTIVGERFSGKTSMVCNLLRAIILRFVRSECVVVFATLWPEELMHLPYTAIVQDMEDVRALWQHQRANQKASRLLLVIDMPILSNVRTLWFTDLLMNHRHFRTELVVCVESYSPLLQHQLDAFIHMSPDPQLLQLGLDTYFDNGYSIVESHTAIHAESRRATLSKYKTRRYMKPVSEMDWSNFRRVVWHGERWCELPTEMVNCIAQQFDWYRKY